MQQTEEIHNTSKKCFNRFLNDAVKLFNNALALQFYELTCCH